MKRLLIAILCTGAAGTAVAADTPRFPVKPIRMVVPFGAGSNSDLLARTVAVRMSEHWGQQVVVDNRPGAGGRARAVNRVPACGMRTSASRETRR